MPEAVQTFVDSNNFAEVLAVQRDILQSYKDDIAKYAPGQEKAKAKTCFDSLPRQLSRDYKKFSYSVVETKAGARKYAGSLQWLSDAHIVNYCFNLSRPALPLEGNVIENAFKVYMADTGLLVAMLEDGSQKAIIDGNLGIYKGAIYENIVADILAKAGKKLYYFERNSTLEIDFILNIEGEVVGVEVKSAINRKAKSLNSLIQNHGAAHGIKLSPANIGADGNIETLPLYMTMFL
jgi:predicted AAA+ superfamily ATPase